MSRLTRAGYEQLIAEDIAWLLQQPRTLERDHIEAVLRASPAREYERAEGVVSTNSFPDAWGL